MTINKLEFSVPANNRKVIELYNKLKSDELNPKPIYQRKLVWKRPHKYKFIQTILLNFPFPEVYLAPGILDTDSLILKDQIVDGQQRLTTISNYIDGKDVFALDNMPIPKFSELPKTAKEDFLNYEISVRYLKNANEEQIREIFQRINSTEYSLNKTERINAQWGDSEFICFAKQMVEKDLDIDSSLINYTLLPENRSLFLNFFHDKYTIFSENDINRMLALQFILTLLATICEGEYFSRNDKVEKYILEYNEEFVDAGEIEIDLKTTIEFIKSLNLRNDSYWFNKANIFTLIIECLSFDVSELNKESLKNRLEELELQNLQYLESQSIKALKDFSEELKNEGFELVNTTAIILPPSDNTKYFDYAKEGVNEKTAREYRGTFIKKILTSSLTQV